MDRTDNMQHVDISQRVAQLLVTRNTWIQREAITHSLKEDAPIRGTLHAFDVDTTLIDETFSDCPSPYVYIPLKWHKKGVVNDVKCTTAGGQPLCILGHELEVTFAERYFWKVVESHGYNQSLLPLIADLVHRGIEATKNEIESLLTSVEEMFETQDEPLSRTLERQHQETTWREMQEITEIRDTWNLILEHQITSVRVRKGTDYSTLELAEPFDYRARARRTLDPLDATYYLSFEEPRVQLVRLTAPGDMRILHGFRHEDDPDHNTPPAEVCVLEDGTWATCRSSEEGSIAMLEVRLAPRQLSELLVGLITSGIALAFVFTFWERGLSIFRGDAVSAGDLIQLVLTLTPNAMSSISSQGHHSTLYQSIMMKYRAMTLLVTALVFFFPLLPTGRPSEISWPPGPPGIANHFALWVSEYLRMFSVLVIYFCFIAFAVSLASASLTLRIFVLRLRRRVTQWPRMASPKHRTTRR